MEVGPPIELIIVAEDSDWLSGIAKENEMGMEYAWKTDIRERLDSLGSQTIGKQEQNTHNSSKSKTFIMLLTAFFTFRDILVEYEMTIGTKTVGNKW